MLVSTAAEVLPLDIGLSWLKYAGWCFEDEFECQELLKCCQQLFKWWRPSSPVHVTYCIFWISLFMSYKWNFRRCKISTYYAFWRYVLWLVKFFLNHLQLFCFPDRIGSICRESKRWTQFRGFWDEFNYRLGVVCTAGRGNIGHL